MLAQVKLLIFDYSFRSFKKLKRLKIVLGGDYEDRKRILENKFSIKNFIFNF
jgi:hypothetical protein